MATHAPDPDLPVSSGAHLLGDPHAVPDTDFPEGGDPADQLRFLLHYAVLAPSVLNTQPWRFAVEGNVVRLYANRKRQLRRIDPDGRELVVSCGAALLNLRVAARYFGRGTDVHSFTSSDHPDLLVGLVLHGTAQPSGDDDRLFRAIRHRQTNRHPFADAAVPDGLTAALELAARDEGACLVVLEGAEEKETVARLVDEGVRLQRGDPETAAELDAWLRPKGDPRRDGVSDELQGRWDRLAVLRTPTSTVAKGKRELVANSPAVLVLATNGDQPADWLAAGQALGRVLLTAAARDLQASYANQPVEVPSLRRELADLVGGRFPQVVLRVGFPVEHEGTRRRYMQDVLLEGVEDSPSPRSGV